MTTRTILRGAAWGVGFATFGLLLALVLRPVSTAKALDAYVLVLGAIALLAFVRSTRSTGSPDEPSALELALQPVEEEAERPKQLDRLEREVDLALSNAFYLHYRLRPLAREIASHRLGVRRGVELDTARDAFGEAEWELVRPERPEPRDFNAPGIPLARLRALVATLERL